MRILHKNFQKKRLFTLIGVTILLTCLLQLEFITVIFKNGRLDEKFQFENKKLKNSQVSGKITIAGNWSATQSAGICSGSGTYSDPYIIKDLVIDGGGAGVGILIVNSKKKYFKIENCTIFNCWYAIRLLRSCNGTLLNNNCSNNDNGIYLDGWTDDPHFTYEQFLTFYCMNNTVLNNTITKNVHYGIYTRHSDNNSITGNYIDQNDYGIYLSYFNDNNTITNNFLIRNIDHGIFLEMGGDNTIKGNKMYSCGFYTWDEMTFTYNIIDTTNLVNDGHLYFYANRTDLNDDELSNAGQIYLVNCSNSIISDLDLSDGSVSISLYDCIDIKISHNNLSSNNLWGLYLWQCDNISIIRNEINENHHGIEGRINNSLILENQINKNYWSGITISGHNNIIASNSIKYHWFRGLEIKFFCENNTVFDNNIENNIQGMYLVNSFSNISENVISGNMDVGIYLAGGSNNNTLFLNFFRNNGLHIEDNGLNNKWNNSYIGNYWDNYTGIDANGDGIGDTPHNISSSPLVQDFLPILDNDPPSITIMKPTNNSKFGSSAPSFEVIVNEKFLDQMWYTLDGGLHNYTFTENGTIDQNAWNELPNGQIILRFYAIDKPGYMVFKEITIRKDVSSLDLLIIILSVVIPVIGIISVGIILLILRKRKLEKLT